MAAVALEGKQVHLVQKARILDDFAKYNLSSQYFGGLNYSHRDYQALSQVYKLEHKKTPKCCPIEHQLKLQPFGCKLVIGKAKVLMRTM